VELMSASSIADRRVPAERIVSFPIRARQGRLRVPFRAALVWIVAGLAVYVVERAANGPLRSVPAGEIALIKIVLILIAGAIYAWTVRGIPSSVVTATGLAWLTLAIVADVVMGFESVDAGYRLLGDPSVTPEILRDLIIVSWLAAPALSARSQAPIPRSERFRRRR
jgi:hypothetical protein